MKFRSTRGFTLLEVMVALLIVAIALLAGASAMSQSIKEAQMMRDRTYASWIAQNRITELRLAPATPDVGATNGEVQYANTDWKWRAVVSDTGVDDLYRIDVSVSFTNSDNIIRTVTGFVGPPGSAGMANNIASRADAWGRGSGPAQGSRN
jgi:general secretion pathway protein I